MKKAAIIIPGIMGIIITLIGYFFKKFHWPGGQNMLLAGSILILISVVFVFINLLPKKN